MKTIYFVKTQSETNESLLHSTMKREFESESFEEAKAAFDKEVEALGRAYQRVDDLGYPLSEREARHALYCSITKLDFDEDGEPGDLEFIEDSEYFYNDEK